MTKILSNPFLWLALSVFSYEIGLILNRKFKNPIVNPLLIATLIMLVLMAATRTDLITYNKAGGFITMFLTPSTVVLAVPIYKQFEKLKSNYWPIFIGAFVGSLTSMTSVYVLCRLFGLDREITASLLPKSVTTPIGVEVSQTLGGIPAVTVISIVITGLVGAMLLPEFLKLIRVDHDIARGISIGTASHAVGTSRALELGDTVGAMSGLAIGIAGIITVLLSIIFSLFL